MAKQSELSEKAKKKLDAEKQNLLKSLKANSTGLQALLKELDAEKPTLGKLDKEIVEAMKILKQAKGSQ